MKIAYLIFTYSNPKHLKRLVTALNSQECYFFIHIDQKIDISAFKEIEGNNIKFCDKRIYVYWAEFSGVQAIFTLINQAIEASHIYDYFVLLSGTEYPLKSNEYIYNFFLTNLGAEYISIVKMPCESAGKPISRLNTYRPQSNRPFYQFIMKILAKLTLANRDYRKYFADLEPYSGNTWWSLTRESCIYILDFCTKNKEFVNFFKNTFAPEETFFHTILGNSPFKTRIKRNIFYEDWSKKAAHPEIITEKHVSFFEKHDKIIAKDIFGEGELLFARKFTDHSINLIERINKIILTKS